MKKLANKKTPNNDNSKNVVKLKGYALSKHNATKHGVFSKNTVMEWESKEEYDSLVECLVEEYKPKQITERYLVEELASVMWRKNRLKYAERARLQSSLNSQVNPKFGDYHNKCADDALLLKEGGVTDSQVKRHIISNQDTTQLEINNLQEAIDSCSDLIKKLQDESLTYESACDSLHSDIKEDWEDVRMYDDDGNQYDSTNLTSEDLEDWLERQKKSYEEKIYQLKNREQIKNQVIGSTLIPDGYTEQFIRCENHLDRKFEKALSMLVKLQELRSTKDANLAKSVL